MLAVSQFLRELQEQIKTSGRPDRSSAHEPEEICGRWLAFRRDRQGLTLIQVEQLTGIPVSLLILLEIGLATSLSLPAQALVVLRELLAKDADDKVRVDFALRIASGSFAIKSVTPKVSTANMFAIETKQRSHAINHGDLQSKRPFISNLSGIGKTSLVLTQKYYLVDFGHTANGPKIRDNASIESNIIKKINEREYKERNVASDISSLRLDIAAPKKVFLSHDFILAVAIRKHSSPILSEKDLRNLDSGIAQIIWSDTSACLSLNIRLDAPNCTGNNERRIILVQNIDSPIFYFSLTPHKKGTIGIVVTLYQNDDALGSARLQVKVQQKIGDEQNNMAIATMPIKSGVSNSFKANIELSVDDKEHERELIDIYTRRLRILQVTQAAMGIHLEPYRLMEIQDIEKLLKSLGGTVGGSP